MKRKGKAADKLAKSPVNYFSDLFIAVMVCGWIALLAIMVVAAVHAQLALSDTSVWSTCAELVTIPLSCGGAIWMVKNSVQHAIANNRGEECPYDFPAVDSSETIDAQEQALHFARSEDTEDE